MKDWDTQRQRLPDSRCRICDYLHKVLGILYNLNTESLRVSFSCSNVDKVRDFIKSVYVDRRYAIGKSFDKPPRDTQAILNSFLNPLYSFM